MTYLGSTCNAFIIAQNNIYCLLYIYIYVLLPRYISNDQALNKLFFKIILVVFFYLPCPWKNYLNSINYDKNISLVKSP